MLAQRFVTEPCIYILKRKAVYVYHKILNISRNCLGQVLVSKVAIPRFRFHAIGYNFYGPYTCPLFVTYSSKSAMKDQKFPFLWGPARDVFPITHNSKSLLRGLTFEWMKFLGLCVVGIQKGSAARGKQSLWGQCCVNICPLETASHAHGRCAACRYKRSHCASPHQVSLSTNAGRLKVSLKGLLMLMWQSENSDSNQKCAFYLVSVMWSIILCSSLSSKNTQIYFNMQ